MAQYNKNEISTDMIKFFYKHQFLGACEPGDARCPELLEIMKTDSELSTLILDYLNSLGDPVYPVSEEKWSEPETDVNNVDIEDLYNTFMQELDYDYRDFPDDFYVEISVPRSGQPGLEIFTGEVAEENIVSSTKLSYASRKCDIKASSWKDQQEGGYGSVYDIDYDYRNPIVIDGWKLTFGAYVDEDGFWFEDDSEGGTGGTEIGAIAFLENEETGATIRFPFGISYSIFGNPENKDEFYLYEPDRSLDKDNGILYHIDDIEGIDKYDAKQFVEDHNEEIFDAIIQVMNQNLYKFGYEL